MEEKLLQFIWQNKLFNLKNLHSTDNKSLEILQVGFLNKNQGPDFIHARIVYDKLIWAGSVEIHIKASDWKKHKHDNDTKYDPVILHVVWENDLEITNSKGQKLVTLTLQPLVSKILIDTYKQIMNQGHKLPCSNFIQNVHPARWIPFKEKLVIKRLERKTALIKQLLNYFTNNWELVAWSMVSAQLGGPINGLHFEQIMKQTPLKILQQNMFNRTCVESILFGQSNLLLKDFKDDYPNILKKEYTFYKQKYQLTPIYSSLNFMRMRPASFPTIRLSQLAGGLIAQPQIFSAMLYEKFFEPDNLFKKFQSYDYWHTHYNFDEPMKTPIPQHIGSQLKNRLYINVVVPLRFAYHSIYNDYNEKMAALDILLTLPKEDHKHSRLFEDFGIKNNNALDSQAFVELFVENCNHKHCLSCTIGESIFNNKMELKNNCN